MGEQVSINLKVIENVSVARDKRRGNRISFKHQIILSKRASVRQSGAMEEKEGTRAPGEKKLSWRDPLFLLEKSAVGTG